MLPSPVQFYVHTPYWIGHYYFWGRLRKVKWLKKAFRSSAPYWIYVAVVKKKILQRNKRKLERKTNKKKKNLKNGTFLYLPILTKMVQVTLKIMSCGILVRCHPQWFPCPIPCSILFFYFSLGSSSHLFFYVWFWGEGVAHWGSTRMGNGEPRPLRFQWATPRTCAHAKHLFQRSTTFLRIRANYWAETYSTASVEWW